MSVGRARPQKLPCSECSQAYCAARELARPVLGGRWCASTSRQAPRAVGPVTSASRTRRLGGAAGRVSPYISEIVVTVAEGDHGAHLNPLVARIGLGAFRFDAPRSNSMAEVASQAVVAAAGWWSRMRRSGPCSAARLSPRRWLGRTCGSLVHSSAPPQLLGLGWLRCSRTWSTATGL